MKDAPLPYGEKARDHLQTEASFGGETSAAIMVGRVLRKAQEKMQIVRQARI